MSVRLAIYAIPFGFGPVSKAVSIIRSINNIMDVEWHLIGSGISYEFLERENISAQLINTDNFPDHDSLVESISRSVDGAVVLMDNKWANDLAERMPVFFVDSLGYMWRESDFASFPGMRKMKAYYVQDVFESVEKMRQTGLPNINPVPPILNLDYDGEEYAGRNVFHLGGALNPFNPETTRTYLEGMGQIFHQMGVESPLVLMSDLALHRFPGVMKGVEVKSLSHEKSLSAMASSKFMWSSPGLTTMLESSALGISMGPLPPQNYSQALNTRNLNRHFREKLHEVWHFLDFEYREITPDMDERDGVAKITELNGKKLKDSGFVREFSTLALGAMNDRARIPTDLAKSKCGAQVIAEEIKSFFLTFC